MASILPPIGSLLPFPNSSDTAILKYVGSVSGHDGVFCGLELCGSLASRGKNNGSVNGTFYFEVSVPNSGLFVPLRKVVGWLSNNNLINNNHNDDREIHKENEMMEVEKSNTNTILSGLSLSNSNLTSPNLKNDLTISNSNNVSNTEIHELRRHINILEKRLVQRENDMKELDIQLDELDATLRANDARLARKEERFNRYRSDKEEEINLLVSTIESLEKKVGDTEDMYTSKIKRLEENVGHVADDTEKNAMRERIAELENELSIQKDMYQTFKISKSKEIDALHKVEMENYKIKEELESLREQNVDNTKVAQMEVEKDELLKSIDNLKLDLELRDNKIGNLEELLKNIQAENETLRKQIDSKSKMLDENGSLKVFVPEEKIDPSAGRDDFCNFCDRDGHKTEDCPYEKDEIEMF